MKQHLRLLHLEDNPLDADIIRESLKTDDFECEQILVKTRQEYESAIAQGHFDLVLSDFNVPGYDGLSALTLARRAMPDVPFILVSGTLGEEQAIESLKAGATDYVLKHRLTRFMPAVRRALQEAKEKADLKCAEQAIRESLREKEALLKEIHHRVKNNLQIISSLLAMQSDSVADESMRALLQESQNRVRAMAMIHEKLYQSSNLARIHFGDYVSSLTGFLFRSYSNTAGRVALKLTVDEVHLNIDSAVPCGLILNELVSNSLKHAFKDGRSGELRVELRAEPEGYKLTVADNGSGLPSDFDLTRIKSLGLQLVETLSRQIKGRLTVESSSGARFQLFFNELGYSRPALGT